jgi:hypothetical protein
MPGAASMLPWRLHITIKSRTIGDFLDEAFELGLLPFIHAGNLASMVQRHVSILLVAEPCISAQGFRQVHGAVKAVRAEGLNQSPVKAFDKVVGLWSFFGLGQAMVNPDRLPSLIELMPCVVRPFLRSCEERSRPVHPVAWLTSNSATNSGRN